MEPKKVLVDDNGKTFDLTVGDELLIVLSENRTTGFRWHVDESGNVVCRAVGENFALMNGFRGSEGTHTWRFAAVAPGDGTIAMTYRRSWESKENSPRFCISIHVTG